MHYKATVSNLDPNADLSLFDSRLHLLALKPYCCVGRDTPSHPLLSQAWFVKYTQEKQRRTSLRELSGMFAFLRSTTPGLFSVDDVPTPPLNMTSLKSLNGTPPPPSAFPQPSG